MLTSKSSNPNSNSVCSDVDHNVCLGSEFYKSPSHAPAQVETTHAPNQPALTVELDEEREVEPGSVGSPAGATRQTPELQRVEQQRAHPDVGVHSDENTYHRLAW